MEITYNIQLKKEIKNIRIMNIEQNVLTLKYIIEAYIHSFIVFGFNNTITDYVKRIWNEIKQIVKEEQSIHKYLINNSQKINFSEALKLLDKLDDLNKATILYYYESLDDILNACDTKCEYRATLSPKEFSTLIETDEYKIESAGLTIDFDNIKEFLDYPEDFWNYIKPRLIQVGLFVEDNNYQVLIIEDEGILKDMRVIVPNVINLESACINIHEFKNAYELYKRLGQKLDESEKNTDYDSINLGNEFVNSYVLKRFSKTLLKKN